MESNKTS